MLKEYWDLFREWVKNTLRSRIFWLGIVCTLFLAVLVVRLFQLQILDGAAYYDSYVSAPKRRLRQLLQEVLSTTEMESSLPEMRQFIT